MHRGVWLSSGNDTRHETRVRILLRSPLSNRSLQLCCLESIREDLSEEWALQIHIKFKNGKRAIFFIKVK